MITFRINKWVARKPEGIEVWFCISILNWKGWRLFFFNRNMQRWYQLHFELKQSIGTWIFLNCTEGTIPSKTIKACIKNHQNIPWSDLSLILVDNCCRKFSVSRFPSCNCLVLTALLWTPPSDCPFFNNVTF